MAFVQTAGLHTCIGGGSGYSHGGGRGERGGYKKLCRSRERASGGDFASGGGIDTAAWSSEHHWLAHEFISVRWFDDRFALLRGLERAVCRSVYHERAGDTWCHGLWRARSLRFPRFVPGRPSKVWFWIPAIPAVPSLFWFRLRTWIRLGGLLGCRVGVGRSVLS
jgi:hypothetical protein